MTISATIIADSISEQGIRLTTFQLRYPRFIHAEFMTHRVFSRNASSSRAVPMRRLIEDIRRDPAIPIHWGMNQGGMQARQEIPEELMDEAKINWFDAMHLAIRQAEKLSELELHKQIINRLLEPFSHINVVCTATDYENFYALRRHEDAQPEIKALADAMWVAQVDSHANELKPGQWHLPYVRFSDEADTVREYLWKAAGKPKRWAENGSVREALIKVSVARCARVSYLTHDGRQTTVEEDLALYDRLLSRHPLHASPAEHQATPDGVYHRYLDGEVTWKNPEQHANFRGWRQYRKTLINEYVPG
jgi:thymidylate synthase ThyX